MCSEIKLDDKWTAKIKEVRNSCGKCCTYCVDSILSCESSCCNIGSETMKQKLCFQCAHSISNKTKNIFIEED